jgi:phospholipase/carboxylesterase
MKRRHFLWIPIVFALGCTPRLQVVQAGGKGPASFMLLHGYGSDADRWLPYTNTIPFVEGGRWLFPRGPSPAAHTGGVGRQWWDLDLAAHRRQGGVGVDLTDEEPSGLIEAARRVRRSLADEGNTSRVPFVLGGFSQGAMVACQVAFSSDEPLAALVILSGTAIHLDEWRKGFSARKALPVFMAHGRSDHVLPFDLAERLRKEMTEAGLSVRSVAFDGGHEIPAEVVQALGDFLRSLGLGRGA